MAEDKYISDSQQRILQLAMAMGGSPIDGLAPGQLATLNGCSPSQVTRDLANLKHAGWAEQIAATGRWRLGPTPVQLGIRHMTALDRAQRKQDEVKQRFSLGTDDEPAARAFNRYSTPAK